MPFFSRNAVLLAKKEVTYGTDAAPIGANALLVRNLTITPQQAEFASRDVIRPYYGNSEQLPTAISVACEFEIELQGSGTAGVAPGWAPVMRACGFAETIVEDTSVTYAPVSSGFESVTLVYSLGGSGATRLLHKVRGARGTVSITLNAKGIPVLKFRFQGLYDAVVDSAAALAPDFSSFKTPAPANAVNTPTVMLHGVSSPMSDFSIDIANTLVFRSLIGGLEEVLLTDRKPAGSITFEATSVATKDWWEIARNATLGEMQVIHGKNAGSIVEITSSRVQLSDLQYSDQNSIAMLQAKTAFVPTDAGNDELSIILR